MSFEFTRCQSAEVACTAAKTITRRSDGSIDKREYDNTTFWYYQPLFRATHAAMATTLSRLAGRAWDMIVMGAPAPDADLAQRQFRRWARSEPKDNTLVAVPRAWLPVDCDDVSVPEGLGAGDRLPQAAEYVRDNKLPPEFAGVECVVTATSSSGMKGSRVARLRLFFQLDRTHDLSELRRWALAAKTAGLPVDPAVLQAGQPVYTARPRFMGIDDPVPEEQRAFVLPGVFGHRVSLVVGRYDKAAGDIARRVSRAEANCGGEWRALLDQTLGGETGFNEPLKRGLGHAARSMATQEEIADFVVALLADRADPGRQSQYNRGWILKAVKSFRRRDACTDAEIASLKNQLIRRR